MVRNPARSLRLQVSAGSPARGQWCCGRRVKAQWTPGTARRGRRSRPLPGAPGWPSARLRRLLDLPRSASPQRPLARGASSPPTAVGPQRAADPQRVVVVFVRDPSKRPSARRPTRLAGEPAAAVQLVLAATAHRRTPTSRCPPQRPISPTGIRARPPRRSCSPSPSISCAPHRHRTGSTRNGLALALHGQARGTPATTPPTPTCPAPTSRGCRRHRDDRDHRRPTRPCRRGGSPHLFDYEMQSSTPEKSPPTCAWQIPPIRRRGCPTPVVTLL